MDSKKLSHIQSEAFPTFLEGRRRTIGPHKQHTLWLAWHDMISELPAGNIGFEAKRIYPGTRKYNNAGISLDTAEIYIVFKTS